MNILDQRTNIVEPLRMLSRLKIPLCRRGFVSVYPVKWHQFEFLRLSRIATKAILIFITSGFVVLKVVSDIQSCKAARRRDIYSTAFDVQNFLYLILVLFTVESDFQARVASQ